MSSRLKSVLIWVLVIIAILAVAASVYQYLVLGPETEEAKAELERRLLIADTANTTLISSLATAQDVYELGEKARAKSAEERTEIEDLIELKNQQIFDIQGQWFNVEQALKEERAKVPIRTDDELEMSIEDVLASLNPDKEAPFFIGMTTEYDTAVMINEAGLEALFGRTLVDKSKEEIGLLVSKVNGLEGVIKTHEKDKSTLVEDAKVNQTTLAVAIKSAEEERSARYASQNLTRLLEKKISFNLFKPGFTVNLVSVSAYDPSTQRPAVGFLTVGIGWKF